MSGFFEINAESLKDTRSPGGGGADYEIKIYLPRAFAAKFIRLAVSQGPEQPEEALVFWDGAAAGAIYPCLPENFAMTADLPLPSGASLAAGPHHLGFKTKGGQRRTVEILSVQIPPETEDMIFYYPSGNHPKFYNLTSHCDFAWRHPRKWHEARYIELLKAMLGIMRSRPGYIYQVESWQQQLKPFFELSRKDGPGLTKDFKKYLRAGQIELTGALSNPRLSEIWPETFVRNLTLGRKLFNSLAPGVKQDVLNSVDVMAGPSQTPQILKLAGYSYYLFTRPMGRQVVFTWRGLDGTEIISSRSGYSIGHDRAGLIPRLRKLYAPPLERVMIGSDDWVPDSETAREALSWDKNKKRVSTLSDYFREIEKHKDKLTAAGPVLDSLCCYSTAGLCGADSLYVKNNRLENLILLAETVSALGQLRRGPARGDVRALDNLWSRMLENTGHAMCHIFDGDYRTQISLVETTEKKINRLVDRGVKSLLPAPAAGRGVVVVNRLSWARPALVELECGSQNLRPEDGSLKYERSGGKLRFLAENLPPVSAALFPLVSEKAPPPRPETGGGVISNECFELGLDNSGELEVFDKERGRKLTGPGGVSFGTILFRPASPPESDWIMNGPLGKADFCVWDAEKTVFSRGAAQSSLTREGKIENTVIRQTVIVSLGIKRIDLNTEIISNDKRDGVYRIAFPCGRPERVRAGVPFGAESRDNLKDELFREEFFVKGYDSGYYASGWTDISNKDGGLTFACPPGMFTGYEALRDSGAFEFTLLRARSNHRTAGGEGPVEMEGLGAHSFSCAAVPHSPGWTDTDSARAAAEFHNPPRAVLVRGKGKEADMSARRSVSAFSIAPGSLILSAFRPLEDNFYELRFYESAGAGAEAVIAFSCGIESARKTGLNGETVDGPGGGLSFRGSRLTLAVRPWEIVTIRLRLSAGSLPRGAEKTEAV
jgi:hypothetical protein